MKKKKPLPVSKAALKRKLGKNGKTPDKDYLKKLANFSRHKD